MQAKCSLCKGWEDTDELLRVVLPRTGKALMFCIDCLNPEPGVVLNVLPEAEEKEADFLERLRTQPRPSELAEDFREFILARCGNRGSLL